MTKDERRKARNTIIKNGVKGLKKCGDSRSISTLKKIVKSRMMAQGMYSQGLKSPSFDLPKGD